MLGKLRSNTSCVLIDSTLSNSCIDYNMLCLSPRMLARQHAYDGYECQLRFRQLVLNSLCYVWIILEGVQQKKISMST